MSENWEPRGDVFIKMVPEKGRQKRLMVNMGLGSLVCDGVGQLADFQFDVFPKSLSETWMNMQVKMQAD